MGGTRHTEHDNQGKEGEAEAAPCIVGVVHNPWPVVHGHDLQKTHIVHEALYTNACMLGNCEEVVSNE